jgi:hypothetical protein
MTTRYFILLICERPTEKSTAASEVVQFENMGVTV